jgi:uncharacterized protein
VHPRLRAFLARPLARFIVGTLFIIVPMILLKWVLRPLKLSESSAATLSALLGALVALLGYVAYVRWIERRAVSELSGRSAGPELTGGLAIGVLLFAVTIGTLTLLGAFHVVGRGPIALMMAPFAAAVSAGVVEELLFRGILFRIVESAVGSWLAVALSAVVFGLLHLLNAHSSAQGVVAIMLEAGILLAAAFMMTRHLWLPIGLHIGWNFTQGGIFGIAVSGTPTSGLLKGVLSGPDWLSGGIFGAEASLISVIICLITAVVFLAIAIRRGNVVFVA